METNLTELEMSKCSKNKKSFSLYMWAYFLYFTAHQTSFIAIIQLIQL